MEEEWDDWEDNAPAPPPAGKSAHHAHSHQAKTKAAPAVPELSLSDSQEWRWDLSELEQEADALSPTGPSAFERADDFSSQERVLLKALEGLPNALHGGSSRLSTLQALAQVAELHVLAVRESFEDLATGSEQQEKVRDICRQLKQIAGEWGDEELLRGTLGDAEKQQLEEITSLLHQALEAENEDLTLFQEVLEQVFAGQPEQKLVVSTSWLGSSERDAHVTASETLPTYLQQVLTLFDESASNQSRMPTLTEAEIFQDAKDIGRDELLINGHKVEGTRGYDAVVDALQHELEHVLAQQVGKTPEKTTMQVSNALQAVAMAVLHASNRTESGGSAYELLAKFISNHEVDRVLLRPASARATPLDVHMDVGPYVESVAGSTEPTWAFGLRVKLVAVTWYRVCDADDPTRELYEVETSFCNRLGFPVGLTPFHPLECMRKDRGTVTMRLKLLDDDS